MIYCKLNRLDRYWGLDRNLDTAIEFLKTHDLMLLPAGKTAIDGDAVYVNRFDYETVTEGVVEAHLKNIDIHAVLEGEEQVGVTDAAALRVKKRNEAGDLIDSALPFRCLCKLQPGDILIVFPEDAHCPKLCCESSGRVKKAVLKVQAKTLKGEELEQDA